MKKIYNKYFLDNNGINDLLMDAEEFAKQYKLDRRELKRTTLAIEECLIRWQEHFGTDVKISIRVTKFFNKVTFSVGVKGQSFDPRDYEEEEVVYAFSSIVNAGSTYAYKNGWNLVVFSLEQKRNTFAYFVLASIVLGIACGIVGTYLPENVMYYPNYIISNLSDTILGFITMLATPLVFFSILSGSLSIGDVGKFNKIGGKTVGKYITWTTISIVSIIAISILFNPMRVSAEMEAKSSFESIVDVILDIFPSNLLEPFVNDNLMQILLLAIPIAVSVAILQKSFPDIGKSIDFITSLFSNVMVWLSNLIPIVIFATIATSIWNGTISSVLSSLKLFAVVVATILLLFIILLIKAAIVTKQNVFHLLKNIIKLIIMTILGGSSATALSDIIDTATKNMGIKQYFARFASSAGIVMFAPDSAVIITAASIFVISDAGVTLSIEAGIIMMIMCFFFSTAAPPTIGGYPGLIGLIVATAGVSKLAISPYVTVIVLLDYICTGIKVGMLELEMVCLAKKVDALE